MLGRRLVVYEQEKDYDAGAKSSLTASTTREVTLDSRRTERLRTSARERYERSGDSDHAPSSEYARSISRHMSARIMLHCHDNFLHARCEGLIHP
jgi:hypothetical protein